MQIKVNYRILSLVLIFISFSSLFLGFYLDENSAGAGSYKGDIEIVWKNLQIFLANDIISSILHQDYYTSRTPIVYAFHEIFNPFVENITSYRRSVFIISLTLLFFSFSIFCLLDIIFNLSIRELRLLILSIFLCDLAILVFKYLV